MSLSINTNVSSLNAQRNLTTSGSDLATSLQRLSSGMRINSAKDDAAGLAISQRFTTQIRGMDQAARNANDGISLSQTAEGAMGEIGNNLQRIRELAVQSRNATNSASDRAALNAEATQLKAEIDRVAGQTSFNGTRLLDGSFTNQAFQVGANQGETSNVAGIVNASSAALGQWTATGPATPAVASSYTSSQLSSLDMSQAATNATAGAVEIDTRYMLVNYAGSGATIQIGGNAVLTLTKNYTGMGGLATLETDLQNAAAGFTASGSGATFKLTNATSTGPSSTAEVTYNGGTTAVSTINELETPGANAVASSNVQFQVGSASVSLNADYSGANGLATMVASIQSQVGTGYLVAADGAKGFKITSQTAGASVNAQPTGVQPTSVTGVSGGTYVAGADEIAGTGASMTGFATLDISTAAGADAAMLAMDGALTAINAARADMGAVQNRFSSVVANLSSTTENLSSARSRIQDADFAKESAQLSRNQILQQAGTAMLAQANQSSQGVLSLLR